MTIERTLRLAALAVITLLNGSTVCAEDKIGLCTTNTLAGRWSFSSYKEPVHNKTSPLGSYVYFASNGDFVSGDNDGGIVSCWRLFTTNGRPAIALETYHNALYVDMTNANEVSFPPVADASPLPTPVFTRDQQHLLSGTIPLRLVGTWLITPANTNSKVSGYCTLYPQSVWVIQHDNSLSGGEWKVTKKWWRSYLSLGDSTYRVSFTSTNSFLAKAQGEYPDLIFDRCPPPERKWFVDHEE